MSGAAHGGPIADMFGTGVAGVQWGTPLDDVVGLLPGGSHAYARGGRAERVYRVFDDQTLFDVPRPGAEMLYFFDDRDQVVAVAFSIPYERRDELVGALLSVLGPYEKQRTLNRHIAYPWKPDRGVYVSVRFTKEPKHGMLYLEIGRPPEQQ